MSTGTSHPQTGNSGRIRRWIKYDSTSKISRLERVEVKECVRLFQGRREKKARPEPIAAHRRCRIAGR